MNKMNWRIALIVCTLVCVSNPLKTGFIWHISDIHVDQNYSRSGNPYDLCHEGDTAFQDNGLYGNFLCDAPYYLVDATFQAMKDIKPNPDFILWTGDNLPHTRSFDANWDVIYEALHNISVLFDMNFPGVPVYPCIGNHDTFPPNMLLPNDSSYSIYQDILVKGGWSKYLNKESRSTFIKGGFYSQLVKSGLRIISLNTILWYAPNSFTENMDDPANQFKWLEEVLVDSLYSLEKVFIIGHVPPGFYNRVRPYEKSQHTYHQQHLNKYLRLLKKFSNVIAGQMFGHLHIDMFQIFSFGSSHFSSSSILASSVSPWHFQSPSNVSLPVNPSIRLLHYDSQNGFLKDYDQFYLNLTKANNLSNIKEYDNLYELLYTFTKAYDVPDLSTNSLAKVFEKMKRNDSVFDMFFKFSTAGKESVICDDFCKVIQLCSISSIGEDENDACVENRGNSSAGCYEKGHLNVYPIVIVFIILCALFFLCLCTKYKTSDHELYTKLLKDY